MSWTYEALREIVPKKELSKRIKQMRSTGYELAALKSKGNKTAIAFIKQSSTDQFDFATELSLSRFIGRETTLYIEALEDEQCLFVEFEDELPVRSRVLAKSDVESELRWLQEEKKAPQRLLIYGDVDSDGMQPEYQDAPLSSALSPSERSLFAPSSHALKPQASKRRKAAIAIGSVIALAFAAYSAWPEKQQTIHIEDYTDVNAPYVRAATKESIDFHTRMLQLFAFHSAFRQAQDDLLDGWDIKDVLVGRTATSFALEPSNDIKAEVSRKVGADNQPSAGAVESFVKSDRFQSLVGQAYFNLSTTTIELKAMSYPIAFDPYSGKHDVREVFMRFADLTSQYVPRAQLQFDSDAPKQLFIERETTVDAKGVFLEDLIGLGGMMKGYPITFDTIDGSKPAIGQYRIDDTGQITGKFSLTILGNKYETH